MLNLLEIERHKDTGSILMALANNIIYRGYDIMTVKPNTDKSDKKQGNGFKDITGQRFGRLVVIKEAGTSKNGHVLWECLCDCNNTIIVFGNNLRRENTKSCGCIRQERMTKHGMCGTKTYQTWQSMIGRCTNPDNNNYHNYGGRGIKIGDKRWLKFDNFLEDMGEKPKGLTIERLDNDGNYEPKNCVYATSTEQNRNKRLCKSNKTGHTGVSWQKRIQKYQAYINVKYKMIRLGCFADINDAIRARKAGELKYWGKREVQHGT